MDFPPFWSKETEGSFSAWGWSHQSLQEAKYRAAIAIKKLVARFQNGRFDLQNRYAYQEGRPMREEVLREFKDSSGKLTTDITRNSYGCQILNTTELLFVDVDLPDAILHEGFLKKMFRGKKPSPLEKAQSELLHKATQWSEAQSIWGWRVYRTFAGFRILATHTTFQPENPACESVFAVLGADPLYRTLCKTQKCFRARLTPKPWRCGIHDKPPRWPLPDEKAAKYFQQWSHAYEASCAKFATCQFIKSIGSNRIHESIKPLLKLHDDLTGAMTGKPLA